MAFTSSTLCSGSTLCSVAAAYICCRQTSHPYCPSLPFGSVGYSPNGLGTCMKCKDRNCVECLPNPYVCSKCARGMRVVRGTCRARYHW